jgi:hypothetical protein
MATFRGSRASRFNLLHVTYRAMRHLDPEMGQTASRALVVRRPRDRGSASAYQEPAAVAEDDESSILVGFYLERPQTKLIDAAELMRYIPLSSPLLSLPRAVDRLVSKK